MSVFDIFKKLDAERAPMPGGPVEYIIVGLGNPGTKYENTRHNAGFMALDTLAEDIGADVKRLKFKSLTADVSINGVHCLLMKPTTFMNNSGEAVREAAAFYKIPPERIIVIFDDISLPCGKMRIRRKGTDGGHNGIKSIIYHLNSDMFPRIKIGVGSKPHPDYDLADWVLSTFSKDEMPLLQDAVSSACEALRLITDGKTDEAMNKFN